MKKNIVMIGIMLVLALVLIRGTKIQSVDEYYGGYSGRFRDRYDQYQM